MGRSRLTSEWETIRWSVLQAMFKSGYDREQILGVTQGDWSMFASSSARSRSSWWEPFMP